MRLGGFIACLQQCTAHLLPGTKKCEGLVDAGQLACAAAEKIDHDESAVLFDGAYRLNLPSSRSCFEDF